MKQLTRTLIACASVLVISLAVTLSVDRAESQAEPYLKQAAEQKEEESEPSSAETAAIEENESQVPVQWTPDFLPPGGGTPEAENGLVIRSREADVTTVAEQLEGLLGKEELPEGLEVSFALFENLELNGVLVSRETPGPGRAVFQGEWDDMPGDFILAYNQGVLAASFFTPTLGNFRITPATGGRHIIQEWDPSALPACQVKPSPQENRLESVERSRQSRQARTELLARLAAAEEDPMSGSIFSGYGQQGGSAGGMTFTEVDIVIVYTQEAATEAGGTLGIEALIDLAMARTNSAFINSEVGIRLRLVRREEVNYTEVNLSTDLNNLRTYEGNLSDVEDWRDDSGADLVAMITTHSGGLATLYNGDQFDPENRAFSVNGLSAIESTFAHEIGHNFGLEHHRVDPDVSASPITSYAHGWRFTPEDGPELRTIMAYAPGQRIPYFSNPDVTFMGTPTGVPIGETLESHNAEVLRLTRSAVAAYRSPDGNLPPVITLNSPTYSDSFLALETVNLTAEAEDADGVVTSVEFYRLMPDNEFTFSGNFSTSLGSDTTATYTVQETEVPAGFWTYAAVAYDDAGGYGVDTVSVVVAPHYRRHSRALPAGKSRVRFTDMNEEGVLTGIGHNENLDATDVQAAVWVNETPALLSPLPGDSGAQANAIDADGVVYGQSIRSDGTRRAVRWTDWGAGPEDLSGLITDFDAADVVGVDEFYRMYLSNDSGNAFRRYNDPGHTAAVLNERWTAVSATGVFATGHDYDFGPAAWRALRWRDDLSVQLQPLPGFNSSWGRAVNRSGAVFGFSNPSSDGWNSTTNRLSFWPAGETTAVDPGTLGADGGMPHDLNDFNYAVGSANDPELSSVAILWRGGGDMIDLNRVLLQESGLLRVAEAINNQGQIAVTGFQGSNQIAALLTPLPGVAGENWVGRHFTPEEIEEGLLTSDTVSASGDGVANLLKRAVGLDPRRSIYDFPSDAGALPRAELEEDGHVRFVLRRLRVPGEISYAPQGNTDLTGAAWNGSLFEIESVTPLDDDFEEVIYRTILPLSDLGPLFLRLRVERQ